MSCREAIAAPEVSGSWPVIPLLERCRVSSVDMFQIQLGIVRRTPSSPIYASLKTPSGSHIFVLHSEPAETPSNISDLNSLASQISAGMH